MTDDFIQALKDFLSSYQADEALAKYRRFVNVYSPREEDIQAIFLNDFEVEKLQTLPSAYGAGQMLEFKVGQTTFRVWGEALQYIEQQSGQQAA